MIRILILFSKIFLQYTRILLYDTIKTTQPFHLVTFFVTTSGSSKEIKTVVSGRE